MIGTSQGETEIPLGSAEVVLPSYEAPKCRCLQRVAVRDLLLDVQLGPFPNGPANHFGSITEHPRMSASPVVKCLPALVDEGGVLPRERKF